MRSSGSSGRSTRSASTRANTIAGSTKSSARSRTSCSISAASWPRRRAERRVLELSRVEPLGEWPLRYVNRLSDTFFVLGRWVAKHMGEREYLWERALQDDRR